MPAATNAAAYSSAIAAATVDRQDITSLLASPLRFAIGLVARSPVSGKFTAGRIGEGTL